MNTATTFEVYAIRDNGDEYFVDSFTNEDAAIMDADSQYRHNGFEYVVVEGDQFDWDAIIYSTTGESGPAPCVNCGMPGSGKCHVCGETH